MNALYIDGIALYVFIGLILLMLLVAFVAMIGWMSVCNNNEQIKKNAEYERGRADAFDDYYKRNFMRSLSKLTLPENDHEDRE